MTSHRKPPESHQIIKWCTVLLMLMALWIWRRPLIAMFSLVGDREAIVAYLHGYGLAAFVVLFILLFLQVFLAPIPGHAFIVAGGYVYGFWPSTLTGNGPAVIMGDKGRKSRVEDRLPGFPTENNRLFAVI